MNLHGNSIAPASSAGTPEPEAPPGAVRATRATIWKSRIYMVIFVVFCIEMGMLLAVLPWTKMWTENGLLERYPEWRAFVLDDFLRGVVSGLGLVDVWMGIWQAIHYHDPHWQPK